MQAVLNQIGQFLANIWSALTDGLEIIQNSISLPGELIASSGSWFLIALIGIGITIGLIRFFLR